VKNTGSPELIDEVIHVTDTVLYFAFVVARDICRVFGHQDLLFRRELSCVKFIRFFHLLVVNLLLGGGQGLVRRFKSDDLVEVLIFKQEAQC